jgi:hypothetical protein
MRGGWRGGFPLDQSPTPPYIRGPTPGRAVCFAPARIPDRDALGNFVLDRGAWRVTLNGARVHLALQEFKLLSFLIGFSGCTHSPDSSIENVCGASTRGSGGRATGRLGVRRAWKGCVIVVGRSRREGALGAAWAGWTAKEHEVRRRFVGGSSVKRRSAVGRR